MPYGVHLFLCQRGGAARQFVEIVESDTGFVADVFGGVGSLLLFGKHVVHRLACRRLRRQFFLLGAETLGFMPHPFVFFLCLSQLFGMTVP